LRPDDPNADQVGSFQEAISVPACDPDAGTLVSVCYNQDYTPFILGCLLQGLQRMSWDTPDDPAALLAEERVNNLMYLFQTGCDDMPTGAIAWFAGTEAPAGWVICDGSALNRVTDGCLFAVIGTAFGVGDGSTTFNLPDLRGRDVIGQGQQSGGTNFVRAAHGGEETHTLTIAEMPSHVHAQEATLIEGTSVEPPFDASGPNPLPVNTGSTGGDGAHNNLQPYLVLLPIIKT